MTKLQTKILLYIFVVLLVLSSLLPLTAFAAEIDDIAFDATNVMDDLRNATVFGKKFSINDYPKTANGEVRLLDLAEYCYSTYPEYKNKFGLYVYVYNPTGVEIYDDVKNTIELGFDYELNENNEYAPTSWHNRRLKLLSVDNDNVFYKFKVVDENEEIYYRVLQTPALRRYDVVSLDLINVEHKINAQAYAVGGTWQYSGFAQGCDLTTDEQSSLTVNISQNQVLTLGDIQSTYYRTWTSGVWADQLNSVYFSVPKNIASDYDDLYSIQAETYRYLTSPIFCVYDRYYFATNSIFPNYEKLYNDLYKQRGISYPYKKDKSLDRVFYWNYISDTPFMVYNTNVLSGVPQGELDKMAWIFEVSKQENMTVSSDRLMEYMQDYSAEFGKEIRGKYSKDLFADEYYFFTGQDNLDLVPVVQNGKLDIDICVDDEETLIGTTTKFNAWKALFGTWRGDDESEPITPIIPVSNTDIVGLSNEEISQKYYIALDDVDDFKDYVRVQGLAGQVVYLFRFAQSSYYTDEVRNNYGTVGYMAQEVAYLDFDIISLGYRKDGVVTKIPVVSSPIDIISAIESGQEIFDFMYWINQLLQLIGIVILLILLLFIPGVANLLIMVLKFVGWLIALPFRALRRLFKAIFKRRNR